MTGPAASSLVGRTAIAVLLHAIESGAATVAVPGVGAAVMLWGALAPEKRTRGEHGHAAPDSSVLVA